MPGASPTGKQVEFQATENSGVKGNWRNSGRARCDKGLRCSCAQGDGWSREWNRSMRQSTEWSAGDDRLSSGCGAVSGDKSV